MRRWRSIAGATALEILSEPLSLLVSVAAQVLATLAPAFHYHQFGEATRMARDSGFSALLVGVLAVAVFGTVRSFRREIESGTAQMALAHPVSRAGFFLAKTSGAACACLVVASILFATAVVMVNGAAIGGDVAAATGSLAKVWGPSLAIGVGSFLVPLAVAALLNRFARFRFVLTFFVLAFASSVAGMSYRPDVRLVARMVPVALTIVLPAAVFLALTAAAAVRFGAHATVSAAGLLFACALPFLGNYCLSDALSKGGTLPWAYVGLAALAIFPATVAFLLVGVYLFNGKDVG